MGEHDELRAATIEELADVVAGAIANALFPGESAVPPLVTPWPADYVKAHAVLTAVGLTRVASVEHRVVTADGGIMFTADYPDSAKHWCNRLRGYGKDVHVETWERSYFVTKNTFRQITVPIDEAHPYTVDSYLHGTEAKPCVVCGGWRQDPRHAVPSEIQADLELNDSLTGDAP